MGGLTIPCSEEMFVNLTSHMINSSRERRNKETGFANIKSVKEEEEDMAPEASKLHVFFFPLMAHGHGDKQAGLDIEFQVIPFPTVEAGLPEGCESTSSLTSPAMLMNFFKVIGMLQQPFE
ncbi:hypothetical protein IFM89_016804 [Coptis chinensis]|uniref:Uncharacterized protein n=1 Tax=Coptis chinensis TaxID=261450 RepID=A0A835MFA6_9MAGN|nr:hypothetical protein IFM89_016804 [Coptis chinensis]